MKRPILISVPHAGLRVPNEVQSLCILTEQEVIDDGDVGAAQIYFSLREEVGAFVTTDVARAIVDINRAEDDRRKDGIVKTHTCWDVPIYREPLSDELVEQLIDRYHRPYHRRLSELGRSGSFRFAVDCHTMAAKGPPVGPDPGVERPLICLGNGRGVTCPDAEMERMAKCLDEAFGAPIAMNEPFAGGYNVRAHHEDLPWIQLEMSRTPEFSNEEKSKRVTAALLKWAEQL